MMGPTLELDFVARAVGGKICRRRAQRFHGTAIDGRTVGEGGLWFAIRGERLDGHEFAAQAASHGAGGLVIERGRGRALGHRIAVTLIEVDDTTQALGRLARAHREALRVLEVVGVTGSNGKTTTKEMVAAILGAHAGASTVHKTEGNLNNHFGVPLTLLGLHVEHRYAVIEMGMSARGEIAALADLACPRVGIVVNVGPVHLETLGSVDEVARAKGELLRALPPNGVAILPDGDTRLEVEVAASRAACRLRFGARPGVAVRLERARLGPHGTEIVLRLPDGARCAASLAAIGLHHGSNAAAAAAAGYALGVPPETVARGLGAAQLGKHRSTVIEMGGRKILDDCYNASPLSTGAALETLAGLKGARRAIAVLGDMLELGPREVELHRAIGARAAELGIDRLVAIGERAWHIAAGAERLGVDAVSHVTDVEEAARQAVEASRPGDWILIKGSRGMKLERIVEILERQLGAERPRSG